MQQSCAPWIVSHVLQDSVQHCHVYNQVFEFGRIAILSCFVFSMLAFEAYVTPCPAKFVDMIVCVQILNEAGADSLSPETTKQMTDTLFMELNALQNKCYSNGYMAGKQEVAKYCLSTFGS